MSHGAHWRPPLRPAADVVRDVDEAVLREVGELLDLGTAEGWAEGERRFLRSGPVFVTISAAPSDAARLAHEVGCRTAVGDSGPLRAPSTLGSGSSWYAAQAVDPCPLEEVDPGMVAAAVARIPALVLPQLGHPAPGTAVGAVGPVRRALRWGLLRSRGVPLRDLAQAKQLLTPGPGEAVTAHRDLHAGNVLATPDGLHVIDWELTGPAPAGADLAQLLATAEPAYAQQVLAAAAALPGWPGPARMAELRYASAVRTASALLLDDADVATDRAAAAELLRSLPDLRARAGR